MSNAIFTEVIDVELNSGPLEESLTSLVSMYQSKLKDLSAAGLDSSALGGLNVSAINSDLETVRTELKALTDAFMESFGAVAAASQTAGTQVQTNISAALDEVDAKASSSVKTQLEGLSQLATGSQEAWESFAQAAQTALSEGFDPRVRMTANLVNNLYSLIASGGRPAFEALTAQQQDWFLGFQSALAKVEDALRLSATEGTEAWQVEQQKQVAMVEQATKMMEADFKRRAAASNFVDADSEAFQRDQQKQVAIVEQATKMMETDFARRAAAENDAAVEGTDAWQQAQMKQVAVVEEATRMMQADFAKRNEESTGFMSSLTEQLSPEALGRMAGYVVVFGAIYKAIELARDAAADFVGFFAQGVTYLADLQTRTAELQGVLATNVQFSKDQAENFRLAGVSAGEIAKQLQDNAIRYGATVDVLTRGFKSFVESGGASLTHSVSDALQASTLLTVAIKASGKDAETTRAALSEVPKLLDGTITNTSKILETLGLSTAEWKKMVAEAKNAQDLTDQLSVRLRPFLQVAEDSADRFDAIKQSLDLMLQRVEGVAANEFWGTLLQFMKDLKQAFQDNKDKIDDIAKGLGDMVNSILKTADAKSAVQSIIGVFQELSVAVINVVAGLRQLMLFGRTAAAELDVNARIMGLRWGFTEEQRKALQDDIATIKNFKDTYHETISQIEADRQRQVNKVEGKSTDNGLDRFLNAPDLEADVPEGAKSPPDHTKVTRDALVALRAEYQKLFQEVKTGADKEKEEIALNLASRLISVQEAASLTAQVDQKEYDSQLKLIALYRQKAQEVKAPIAAKSSFVGQLDKQQEQLADVNNKAVAQQQQKAITDALKIQDKGLQEAETAINKDAAQRVALITAREKAGTLVVSQGAQQEIDIENRRHTAIQQMLMEEVTNAGENADLRNAAAAKLDAEDAAHTAKVLELSEKRKAALLAEAVAVDAALSKIAHSQYTSDVAREESSKRVSRTSLDDLQAAQKLAQEYLSVTEGDLEAAKGEEAYARSLGVTGKALDDATAKTAKMQAARDKAKTDALKADKAVVQSSPVVAALQENFQDWKTLFGDFSEGNKAFTEDLRGFATDLADTMASATAVITAATKEFTTISEAIQKNGALGGIGAGLSGAGGAASALGGIGKEMEDGGSVAKSLSSSLSGLFKNAGVVGSLLSAAGGLISAISSMFTAAARRIAQNIDNEFKKTIQAYQDGAATLQATIAAVQQERADAISQLSGKKGGQDQLDKLLPQLDSEIAQLEQQQKTIITNFETSLQKLQLHSTVLSQTLDTWNQINQSVKDYINAGGDAAKAAEYLSESLSNLRLDAANNIAQGDKDAIAQAIQYNQLLVQRQQLTEAYNKAKFDTMNADALERRASNAVSVGMTQKAADEQYQSSLTDLNSQIDLAAKEVSMYKDIYNIAADTAALKAQSNALELQTLAQTISSLKDYQQVYSSIYQRPDGTFATSNGAGTGASGDGNTTTVGQIVVNVTTTGPVDGADLASTIQSELQKNGRYGVGSTFTNTAY